ncbi:hypothetical protein C1H46_041187 [Malus baccata]|uniref:Uncharacterized protein n=1 Tax=Malus baccata TaxID=106549 RepID=A0A540KGI3_MALBA|nr:hypothetical protein C1H46_041187 [Malus baccata]
MEERSNMGAVQVFVELPNSKVSCEEYRVRNLVWVDAKFWNFGAFSLDWSLFLFDLCVIHPTGRPGGVLGANMGVVGVAYYCRN